ncbi:MAG: hypothetical protein ACLUVC_16545 [Longibaculum sp.]
MTYDEYVKQNGKLDEAEFNELLPFVISVIDGYIADIIPKWNVRNSVDDYGLNNLDFVFKLQIDFIASCGGINALMGRSDFDIKSVVTSGISMQIGDARPIKYHDGVPISPIVESLLIKELRKKDLLKVAVW